MFPAVLIPSLPFHYIYTYFPVSYIFWFSFLSLISSPLFCAFIFVALSCILFLLRLVFLHELIFIGSFPFSVVHFRFHFRLVSLPCVSFLLRLALSFLINLFILSPSSSPRFCLLSSHIFVPPSLSLSYSNSFSSSMSEFCHLFFIVFFSSLNFLLSTLLHALTLLFPRIDRWSDDSEARLLLRERENTPTQENVTHLSGLHK